MGSILWKIPIFFISHIVCKYFHIILFYSYVCVYFCVCICVSKSYPTVPSLFLLHLHPLLIILRVGDDMIWRCGPLGRHDYFVRFLYGDRHNHRFLYRVMVAMTSFSLPWNLWTVPTSISGNCWRIQFEVFLKHHSHFLLIGGSNALNIQGV